MIRNRIFACGIPCAALLITSFCGYSSAAGAPQAAAQQPSYTPAEYNSYIAASKDTDSTQRRNDLASFATQYPNSTLMPYVLQLQAQTYAQLKDYPNAIATADKLVAMGDKVAVPIRLQAAYLRAQAFEASFTGKEANAADLAKKEHDTAAAGLDLLNQMPLPANMTADKFAESKKPAIAFFNQAIANAAFAVKDYKAAADAYKVVLAGTPNDALSAYRLGVSDLQQTPQTPALFLDGTWALARAIALKVPDDAKVRDYLQKQISNYEQPACDNLLTDQVTNIVTLATQSPDRPATFMIPSADDLNKVRQALTVPQILDDLQTGGDKAKTTWLAACGLQFPQVPAKVITATAATDNVDLQLATGATDDVIQAATTANIDAKVMDQPEASRLQKDDELLFAGTLASYDPTPLLLHFDKCKVDPQYIPEAGKHTAKRLHH
jgi:tetratricopeptide (TPR) repeat protein